MVHARLHLICGNCGNNEGLKYSIDLQGIDDGSIDDQGNPIFQPDCFIHCPNCSTLHSISSELEKKEK